MNPPISKLLMNEIDNASVTSGVYTDMQPKFANQQLNNQNLIPNMYGNQDISGFLNMNSNLSQNMSNMKQSPNTMAQSKLGQSMLANSLIGRSTMPSQYFANTFGIPAYQENVAGNQQANNSFMSLNPSLGPNNMGLLNNSFLMGRESQNFNRPVVSNDPNRGFLAQLPLHQSNLSASNFDPMSQLQQNIQKENSDSYNQVVANMLTKGKK